MNARLARAIEAFAQWERALLLTERRERQVQEALAALPDSDLPEYARLTEEVEAKYGLVRARFRATRRER